MQQDVFVDLLFIINFSMDSLCLYICAKIMHRKVTAARILLASAIGGLYSVLALFISVHPTVSIIIDILVCLIICAICFAEFGRRFISIILSSFLFLGISMMTGGCMTAIFNFLNRLDLPLSDIDEDSLSTYLFAIVAAIAGFICLRHGQLITRRSSITECEVTIFLRDNEIKLYALADSGNLVKDPISGKSVIIVDKAKISAHVDLSAIDDFTSMSFSSERFKGLRLIPINTASGKGILTAFAPDNLIITVTDKKGRKKQIFPNSLIAISDIKNTAEGYDAIVPFEIIKL